MFAPELSPQPPREQPPSDRRSRNRFAAQRAVHQFLFYVITFGALYLSVTMPPLFKALFAKTQVFLSDARFIGGSLPTIPIGKSYLQALFFLIAATLYLPLITIAEFITSLLHPIIDSFRPVTERIWAAATMLVFFLFCIPVAATSVWLFYEETFQGSLTIVIMALFAFFALLQSQGGRR